MLLRTNQEQSSGVRHQNTMGTVVALQQRRINVNDVDSTLLQRDVPTGIVEACRMIKRSLRKLVL